MRPFQIVVFGLGAATLLASACFIGKDTGETLWKTGIATLLFDVVCLQLWPSAKRA